MSLYHDVVRRAERVVEEKYVPEWKRAPDTLRKIFNPRRSEMDLNENAKVEQAPRLVRGLEEFQGRVNELEVAHARLGNALDRLLGTEPENKERSAVESGEESFIHAFGQGVDGVGALANQLHYLADRLEEAV